MKIKKGFTLVEIMVVVAIIALLATFAIPSLLRSKISSNDAFARAKLRMLSTASETYSLANSGNYPANSGALTGATPPYLNEDPCGQTMSGFTYACTFGAGGYTIVATPIAVSTGSQSFTMTTGGVLQ